MTAIARYQQLTGRRKRPNKRIRKAAWKEARVLIEDGVARDERALTQLREQAKTQALIAADTLYGAQKYGRDVTQPLVIPEYRAPAPLEPEHSFRLIRVEGGMHLWYDEAWVQLSGELLRRVESAGLRVTLAQACQFQEMRVWASHQHRLNFRDEIFDVSARYAMERARREWRR